METNQKFVPVFDAAWHSLTEHFIGIANIESQGSGRNPQGLRARDPAALRRREVLLRRGPEDAAGAIIRSAEVASPTSKRSAASWDKSVRVAELAAVIANRVGVDAGAGDARRGSLSQVRPA